MNLDELKQRLSKMKALANAGTGGERAAADNLIRRLCEKYRLSLDDFDTEVEREHTFQICRPWQRQILQQLLGLMRIEIYNDRHADKLCLFVQRRPGGHRGSGKKRRTFYIKRYYTVCTDFQFLELSAKFEILCRDYDRQLKAFPLAFLMSNDLLMPYDPTRPHTAPDEEYNTASVLASGIMKSKLHKQLELKDCSEEGV